MGRVGKEELARLSGAQWMLRLVKDKGIENAEKELNWRTTNEIPLQVSETQLNDVSERIKTNTIESVMCLASATLRDEFGFGHDRLKRFADRFNKKTECLQGDFVTWKAIAEQLEEEIGIRFHLSDEVIQATPD